MYNEKEGVEIDAGPIGATAWTSGFPGGARRLLSPGVVWRPFFSDAMQVWPLRLC
jgi:hypothetical protein